MPFQAYHHPQHFAATPRSQSLDMQLSEPGDPPPSGPRLQIPNPSGPLPSKLYKAYFDEPVLSDLTIRLSDRTVHTHRIVLCRGSKYFTKLLTGRFQVSLISLPM